MQTIAQALAPTLAAALSPETTPKPVSDAGWKPVLDAYEPSLKVARDLAAELVRDMATGKPPHWLTFTGVPGCGKTFLARQIFDVSRAYNPGELQSLWVTGSGFYNTSRRRPRRVWLDANEFADRLRKKEYDLPEYLAADFLVVLDDLGAARDTTAFIAEAVYRLCNARMGKWTVFTSNLDATAISAQIDPRVTSRLIRDGNIAHRITAGDYALRQRT